MIKPSWKHYGIIYCTSQFDCFFILVIDREGFFRILFFVLFLFLKHCFSVKKKNKNKKTQKTTTERRNILCVKISGTLDAFKIYKHHNFKKLFEIAIVVLKIF